MKMISKIVALLTISLMASIAHAQLCRGDIDTIESLVCNIVEKTVAGTGPLGNVAVFYISMMYSQEDTSPWQQVKRDAERLVDEKIDAQKLKDVEDWHDSMKIRVTTCEDKTDRKIKRKCLQNLQEDIAGFEPHFRGNNRRQTATKIKYYQNFITTYLVIAQLLTEVSGKNMRESVEKDVIRKVKIYSKYLTSAIKDTQLYNCRHIKIEIERERIWWWSTRMYWPDSIEDIKDDEVDDVRRSTIKEELRRSTIQEENPQTRIGCGVAQQSANYASRVWDDKAGKALSGRKEKELCSEEKLAEVMVPLSKAAWKKHINTCMKNYSPKYFAEILALQEALLDFLKNKQ